MPSLLAVNYGQGVQDAWSKIATFIPEFVAFLIVIVVGLLVAKVIAKLIAEVLHRRARGCG